MTRPAMIVAAQPEAAEAGARVLQQGGNAVDAAIAAALVQGVVDPQMCGVAGFGSCHIFLPSRGVHCCIDFHGKTPLAAHPAMWEGLLEGETRDQDEPGAPAAHTERGSGRRSLDAPATFVGCPTWGYRA